MYIPLSDKNMSNPNAIDCKMTRVHGDTLWRCVIVCLFSLIVLALRTVCVYKYEREDLLSILDSMYSKYRQNFVLEDTFPVVNTGRPTSHTQHNTPRRTHKRGRRENALCRFRRLCLWPQLPAIVLANMRSPGNKRSNYFTCWLLNVSSEILLFCVLPKRG